MAVELVMKEAKLLAGEARRAAAGSVEANVMAADVLYVLVHVKAPGGYPPTLGLKSLPATRYENGVSVNTVNKWLTGKILTPLGLANLSF